MKQTSADSSIVVLEAKLGISSEPKDGDVKKTKGETPKEAARGRNRGNPVVTHQALGTKHKKPSWLGSSKGEIDTSCVDDKSAIYISMQTVHLSAHNSLAVVETKIDLNSHADTCVVGNHCLVVPDHNRPVYVFWCNPKVGLKHACIVDAAITFT